MIYVEQMTPKELKRAYEEKKNEIKSRIHEFKQLEEHKRFDEFVFCTLTPQSNAKKCWQAVEQISALGSFTDDKIRVILKSKTRFHNNKTRYLVENKAKWNNLREVLKNNNVKELRNWLAENIKGYGLKEASHFLRNIGKSNNQIAILDRHILRNMQKYNVIPDTKIKNKKDYLEKEQKYLDFADKIGIPPDELDLLWWSQESGEIFK
jgi:N-glycosylase/DNA lyase